MSRIGHFADLLAAAVTQRGTPAMVGLDPRYEQLPAGLQRGETADLAARAAAVSEFCRGIIDVVANLVGVVKPQAAFFEQFGPPGMIALGEVIDHARQKQLVVILDGKRNDIGSTATAYADAYIGRPSAWGVDAMTVSPYLGDDSLTPFVERAQQRGGGLFVLVKTSNPGSRMLQDLLADGRPLYRHVADHVQQLAERTAGKSGYGIVGAVIGATHPAELAELRAVMPNTFFLVPGFGSQAGTARDVAAGFDERGLGAVINNSRGINFAHERREYARFGSGRWQEAVEAATRDMIEQLRAETPAGKLMRN